MPGKPSYEVIILGGPPPPMGGVTTHVERLLYYLARHRIPTRLWNFRGPRFQSASIAGRLRQVINEFGRCRRSARPQVLHAPLSRFDIRRALFLALVRSLGIRVTVTFVASPEQTLSGQQMPTPALRILARVAAQAIVANPSFAAHLQRAGLPRHRITVIPAYLPIPAPWLARMRLPEDIAAFMDAHHPMLITYAHGPDRHNGVDLYGLDLLPAVMAALANRHPAAGLVVAIPRIINPAGWADFQEKIVAAGVGHRICCAVGDHFRLPALMGRADLFVRATNTDGDALSVREALDAGVPTVASDVCHRPAAALLFRSRDPQSLSEAVLSSLSGNRGPLLATAPCQNPAQRFVDVFDRAAQG